MAKVPLSAFVSSPLPKTCYSSSRLPKVLLSTLVNLSPSNNFITAERRSPKGLLPVFVRLPFQLSSIAIGCSVALVPQTSAYYCRQFKLRRSNILTLPRPEEASGAIFPVGSRVMTLYPQTTTFYPATISGPFVEGRVRNFLLAVVMLFNTGRYVPCFRMFLLGRSRVHTLPFVVFRLFLGPGTCFFVVRLCT